MDFNKISNKKIDIDNLFKSAGSEFRLKCFKIALELKVDGSDKDIMIEYIRQLYGPEIYDLIKTDDSWFHSVIKIRRYLNRG